jgi:uncharacterized membrane protein YedE/YeeE
MTIDWTHFTPWSSLAGGVLIGLAAAMLVLLNGRIGGLVAARRGDTTWRVAFVLGLFAAPLVMLLYATAPRIAAGAGTLVVAGLLVGLGTSYGSGCTSGHGVCGLSRLSPRSLVATAAFMAAGVATVYLARHFA